MEAKKEFPGTEPAGRLLLRLSVPTVAAQIINMLYNIVDRIYIGHMPGDGSMALTGVGVCMPLIMLVAAFALAEFASMSNAESNAKLQQTLIIPVGVGGLGVNIYKKKRG